ncbi:MAG: DUF1579 family protein [Kofleriaceae bacterium]
MTTFSKLTIATLTVMGTAGAASAQGTPAKPATPPTAAKPAAPAKAPPAAPPAVKPADMAKPPAMEMPKPAPELTAAAKAMVGTWRCTGNAMMDPSGQAAPMTATMKSKVELDGFWIHDTFDGKMGKMKFKFEAYSTYDPSSKKWRRLMISNDGGQSTGWSDGLKDNKMMFNLESVGPMGTSLFRDYMEIVDARNIKASGEVSMDKGKTWMKVYDMACKK